MSKNRMVNTRFWIDDYISNLGVYEKLLFIYLLTNPLTDICGMYEIPIKNIAVETGIKLDRVKMILEKFEQDGKIFYENGWVAIKNFAKHQLDNPKVKKGIENGTKRVPKSLIDKISSSNDSLYIDYQGLSHSNSNLNSNSNSNSNSNLNLKKEPPFSLFGEFKKVKLLEEEYKKLIEKFGEPNTAILITELDGYIASKGKDPYRNHYAVIQNWARRKFSDYQQKKALSTKKEKYIA